MKSKFFYLFFTFIFLNLYASSMNTDELEMGDQVLVLGTKSLTHENKVYTTFEKKDGNRYAVKDGANKSVANFLKKNLVSITTLKEAFGNAEGENLNIGTPIIIIGHTDANYVNKFGTLTGNCELNNTSCEVKIYGLLNENGDTKATTQIEKYNLINIGAIVESMNESLIEDLKKSINVKDTVNNNAVYTLATILEFFLEKQSNYNLVAIGNETKKNLKKIDDSVEQIPILDIIDYFYQKQILSIPESEENQRTFYLILDPKTNQNGYLIEKITYFGEINQYRVYEKKESTELTIGKLLSQKELETYLKQENTIFRFYDQDYTDMVAFEITPDGSTIPIKNDYEQRKKDHTQYLLDVVALNQEEDRRLSNKKKEVAEREQQGGFFPVYVNKEKEANKEFIERLQYENKLYDLRLQFEKKLFELSDKEKYIGNPRIFAKESDVYNLSCDKLKTIR